MMTMTNEQLAHVADPRVRAVLNLEVINFAEIEYARQRTLVAAVRDSIDNSLPAEVQEDRLHAAEQIEMYHSIWLDGRCTTVEFIDKMRNYWAS